MVTLYITNGRLEALEGLPERGRDILKTDALNALHGPLLARLLGGGEYEILDIEPEIATARINVCGLSQVIDFIEITRLTDINGVVHDPDNFWHDEGGDE